MTAPTLTEAPSRAASSCGWRAGRTRSRRDRAGGRGRSPASPPRSRAAGSEWLARDSARDPRGGLGARPGQDDQGDGLQRPGPGSGAPPKNALAEPTTIHRHGVDVPNPMDGVPGVTQKPIEPARRSSPDEVVARHGRPPS
ncbi:MAG: multicopper oxidase domain-containing protein [Candidatus Rokuibacteriota bacterium]